MKKLHKIFKAGTSEGAEKAWETRGKSKLSEHYGKEKEAQAPAPAPYKPKKHADGANIYGPRLPLEALAIRAKKEKFHLDELKPVLQKTRHYWVEAWARPTGHKKGEYWIYSSRRDGRIGKSWVPIEERHLEFQ